MEWKAIAGLSLIVVGSVMQQVGLEPCGLNLSEIGKGLLGLGVAGAGGLLTLFAQPPVKK